MRGRAARWRVGWAGLAGLLGASALVGTTLWWQLDGSEGQACAVRTTAVAVGGGELLPVADLLPAGSVGDERRPTVRAADALASALALGEVVAGRFHASALDVPAVVPLDAAVPEHVLLATGGAAGSADGQVVLSAVRVGDGRTAWSRSFSAAMRGGGLVGDHLVVVSGERGAVLTLDPVDGRVQDCLSVEAGTAAGGHLFADQAGEEIVLVTAGVDGATVHTVDPGAAEVSWSRRLAGLPEVGTLHVVPDERGAVVLVGRTVADPLRLAELATLEAGTPSLEALALADGHPAWTYEPEGEAAAVVGAGDDGTVVLLTATRDPGGTGGSPRAPRLAVVALASDGAERWRTDLGRDPVGAELWGTSVVLRGAAGDGRVELRALSLDTGTPRWRLTTSGGGGAGRGLGAATALGERYVVPAPAGLLEVDPESGEHRLIRTDLPVDQLLPVGDMVLLRSGPALLVVGPV